MNIIEYQIFLYLNEWSREQFEALCQLAVLDAHRFEDFREVNAFEANIYQDFVRDEIRYDEKKAREFEALANREKLN